MSKHPFENPLENLLDDPPEKLSEKNIKAQKITPLMKSSIKPGFANVKTELALVTKPNHVLPQNRLVIVSNREPYTINREGKELKLEKTPGGLVSALDPVLRQRKGLWVCWEGAPQKSTEFDDVSDDDALLEEDFLLPYQIQSVTLSEEEINHYYFGYANARIWPLFHYFVSRCNFFDEKDWPSYYSANQKFAAVVIDNTTDDDLIWVQDYHLMLVPEMVRLQAPNRKIGFFLHIPFPSVEIFKALSSRDTLLRGMLGSDLIGFHVPDYVEHFLYAVHRLLPANEVSIDWQNNTITRRGRTIAVKAFPISIDYNHIETLAKTPEMLKAANTLRQKYQSYQINWVGLSVDRLDYSKGILEKLEAVRLFFVKYPEYKKKFTFIQIAAPTRTEVPAYKQMREDIDKAVGRINGELSQDEWSPIQYFYRSFSLNEVMPYFMIADLALITPLRDGMNLVAKEYCAAKTQADGALLLSEFTGAATELTDALLINPYNIENVADNIYQAMHLSPEMRREKMTALRGIIQQNDIHAWVNLFMEAFDDAVAQR
ncbi:MAG: trehalose-6-phosphate synthase [Cyanobacteria bacterium P01_H01_bin.74]